MKPIHGLAQRLRPGLHLAEAFAGEARFCWFPAGLPEMDDEDWRQFEITPENAQKMVSDANASLNSGKEIWVNYGHDERGARAGDVVRFELGPDGNVYGYVKWNESARAAILQTPPEWKYFSPEFYAETVTDAQGNPKVLNGRQLLRPFEIAGGALVNVPAMKKLAVAASAEAGRKEPKMNTTTRTDLAAKFAAAKSLAELDQLAKAATEELSRSQGYTFETAATAVHEALTDAGLFGTEGSATPPDGAAGRLAAAKSLEELNRKVKAEVDDLVSKGFPFATAAAKVHAGMVAAGYFAGRG